MLTSFDLPQLKMLKQASIYLLLLAFAISPAWSQVKPDSLINGAGSNNSGPAVKEKKRGKKRYELSNHLGNVLEVISDRKLADSTAGSAVVSGYKADIIGVGDFYPYGAPQPEREMQKGFYRYGFNGIEKDPQHQGKGNSYHTHYRQYDSRLGRWMATDPMARSFPNQSPYIGMDANPIKLTDVNGDSTFVTANDDGTYKVTGGTLNDNDNGIYVKGPTGKIGDMIGYSATPESFYNGQSKTWHGVIDPQDQSGRDFLNDQIIDPDIGLIAYMNNAKGNQRLDFKKTGGTDQVQFTTPDEIYRGMPLSLEGPDATKPVFGSARDVGNIAAGLVAGRNGQGWWASRHAFDILETKQSHGSWKTFWCYPFFGVYEVEQSGTQYAQKLGHRIGSQMRTAEYYEKLRKTPGQYNVPKIKVSSSIISRKDYTPKTK